MASSKEYQNFVPKKGLRNEVLQHFKLEKTYDNIIWRYLSC